MKLCFLGDANSIHIKKICYFFRDRGYDISVISLNDGNIDGVKVYSMNEKIDSSNKTLSKIKYLKNIFKIKKLLNEIKPDILHAHYASSYGLLGSILNYKPYLLTVWGSDIYDFPKKSFIHKNIIRFNFKKSDMILSISKAMTKEINLYTDKSIYVVPFGVNIERFYPDKEKSNEEFTIGIIKTLEDIYGIDILIRAFEIVQKSVNRSVKLKIAGKGSKEIQLKELCKTLNIEEKVEFLGYINQEENVSKVFRSFDLAVFPSHYEGFGVAAVEAQACGVPVIISNVTGLMESTSPNVSSLVFEKGDHKDLAEKIIYIINNDDIRKEMAINARNYVVENYNINMNFDYMDKLYKEIFKVNKKGC